MRFLGGALQQGSAWPGQNFAIAAIDIRSRLPRGETPTSGGGMFTIDRGKPLNPLN
jgi:hypothetical protein